MGIYPDKCIKCGKKPHYNMNIHYSKNRTAEWISSCKRHIAKVLEEYCTDDLYYVNLVKPYESTTE